MSWLLCRSDRSLSYVWCGEKSFHLFHVKPHLWLSLFQHPLKDTNASYFPFTLLVSPLWGFWQSGLTPLAEERRKKGLTELHEKHRGLGNNGTPCCDFVILDTHRTPDIPLTIRRHSFCSTNHGIVCKSTLAALERKPWDNLTNMVTSPAKEKGKKAD